METKKFYKLIHKLIHKLILSVLIVFIVFGLFENCFSQSNYWDRTKRITSGFIDKNPSFDTKRPENYGTGDLAFLVFERWSSTNAANICFIKFNFDSAFGGVQYLTNNNLLNKNPKIAFKALQGFGLPLTNAMVVWEVYENSQSNIYGATYNNNVWSAPYPIDTSSGNKTNPHISYNSATSSNDLYSIVYEKDGDIIYKNFECNLRATWNEYNLTSSEPENCRNPKVSSQINYAMFHFVSYEKQKPNGDYKLCYKKATTSYIWNGDTLTTIGKIKNSNIASSMAGYVSVTYESDKSGKWGLYVTDHSNYNGTSPSYVIVQSPVFNYRNTMNALLPVITDYQGFMNCNIKQTINATKIMTAGGSFTNFLDSITVGDSSSKTVMTLGNGIKNTANYDYMFWMVFDKDSAGLSTLNARGKIFGIAGINQISSDVPTSFSLEQNYPNPFNPSTVIRFNIPERFLPGARRNDRVVLKVYDVMGREVQTLVNEKLNAGSYEVTFDGSGLNSGVYFYRIETENYTETKRMILLR